MYIFILLRTKNEVGEIRKQNILINQRKKTITIKFVFLPLLESPGRKCKCANFLAVLEGTNGYCLKKWRTKMLNKDVIIEVFIGIKI